ncbi:MAG: CDP-alcohol phosphatidyltransferase family protein [Candidatus Micrarchaeota archaeon]|nr:CDP-alcohol phosphatidyltransferase family protein [Candidatus Micrarchaeota archaeon]
MRSADAVTLFRTALMFVIVYMILVKFDPLSTIVLIAIMFILDAVDGIFARRDLKKYKTKSKYGPRLDVASDRAIEYIFWITYVYLAIVPLFVLFIIVLRHSFVDALMGTKGTSSKLKTKFARVIYASSIFRGGINVVKAITFSYLALVYIANWPINIGYALTGILVIYILIRGAAEVWENIA